MDRDSKRCEFTNLTNFLSYETTDNMSLVDCNILFNWQNPDFTIDFLIQTYLVFTKNYFPWLTIIVVLPIYTSSFIMALLYI